MKADVGGWFSSIYTHQQVVKVRNTLGYILEILVAVQPIGQLLDIGRCCDWYCRLMQGSENPGVRGS